MAYKVIIREEAQSETQEAYDYYEKQRLGLGEEFLMALIKTYDDLTEHPTHYGYIAEQTENILRDVMIERFPYLVIFEIADNEVIVYSVHNTYKQFLGWLRRT